MDVGSRRALGSRYELIDRLGSGAMGEVWRTHDRVADELVAAKLLRSDLTQDPEIVGRFIQERSILLGLDHPGIVRVRDLVVEGDDLAIVMDLVTGQDLRAHLRRVGTFAPHEAVTAMAAVLDAIAAAHEQGCLHRDIKPDNVLVEDGETPLAGRVRLSDFGIARLAQESTVQATGLLGTPGYMPPELFSEGRFSGASDVYAAGVMLYELLAGRTPFAGPGTAHTIGFRHVTADPPVLPVPDPLWNVLRAMLGKDPTARPSASGAAAMLRELDDDVLAVPALMPQGDPATWTSTGEAGAPSQVVQVRQEEQLDVGATNIRGLAAPAAPVAEPGEVVPLSPGDPGVGTDQTNIGRHVPTYAPPILEPAAPTPEADRRRTRWWWVLGLVGAAAVIGVVFLFVSKGLPGGGGSAAPSAAQAVEATTDEDVYPTGLGIESSAQYDADSQTISLTMTYSADRSGLDGDVLAVVPPVRETDECPAVAWGGPVTPNIGRSTGVLPQCGGYSIDLGIAAAGDVQVEAKITDIDLGSEPQDALQSWLDRQQEITRAAVTDPKVTGVTSYPLQRLTGLDLRIPSTLTLGKDDAVRVRLYPVFADGKPDELQPLYDSSSTGRPSALLSSFSGGAQPTFTPSSSCDGAVIADSDGTVVVRGQVQGCTLTGRVGNFDDVQSNNLLVVGPNG
ncbi:serine/threonine protein kinase [Aeromicrobium sp. CFBP 8757]|uniref:serine/threonine-protein kinase n=1 Tax=Aeromicrobium sp. CFBP 8757 TaxID=2775288 RepID=UPI00178115B9|nr:serine/threonine-protein kinase [Aeromicrobium sp. CFBP 8757]MBD8605306.1 serine/threonine protein kinase [Aeromicrobium sp. CFBP 8757]